MIRECKKILGEQEFYVGEFYFNMKKYRAALRRFEKIVRDYANVGLDYKVSYYIIETKAAARRRRGEKEKIVKMDSRAQFAAVQSYLSDAAQFFTILSAAACTRSRA